MTDQQAKQADELSESTSTEGTCALCELTLPYTEFAGCVDEVSGKPICEACEAGL